MKNFTWAEGIALLEEIRRSPSAGWTHELHIIRSCPARFVDRAVAPDGKVIVFFRTEDGAGAWPAGNWDLFKRYRGRFSRWSWSR